jgi:drug/metabolite transporter (DMT)-like permease
MRILPPAHGSPGERDIAAVESRAALSAVVLSCLVWGSAFAFGKLALCELTVSQLILLRFVLASLALLPVILRAHTWPRRDDLLRFVLTGILAVPVTFLLQFQGLALTTIARASLIIGTIPPLLALGSSIFLGERLQRRAWMVIAASVLGIAVITGSPGAGGSLPGDGLVLLSCVVSVIWVMMNKRLSEKYGALVATAYLLLIGTVALFPITVFQDGLPRMALPLSTWIPVLVLGFFCTALAFILWNWGLERMPASRAGVFLNLEPLVGTLLGVTLWHDALSPGLIIGGALVIGAALAAARLEPGGASSPMAASRIGWRDG